MSREIHQFLRKKIRRAIELLCEQKKLSLEIPLEYYADDIFRLTLAECTQHFLIQKKLRNSERHALLELQNDLSQKEANEIDTIVIEKRLINNLEKIKPVWGEFLGTNRGNVYNTFAALKKWECFKKAKRLYYRSELYKRLNQQLLSHSNNQQSQLQDTDTLIQHHEETTEQLSKCTIQQFITNQKLRLELKKANETIKKLQAQFEQDLKSQSSATNNDC